MADFFKGLTGGFQSGLQLGEAMRAKQEREALAAIMQEKPTDAGPDFAGQFRMQGLEQGPMPQAEPIQDTQSFMGQQYAQGTLTPDKLTGLRYGAMADVIAQRDPAAALRMRQEQTRMEREAIEAPMRTQALQQQVGLGKVQLTEAERGAAANKRQDDFAAFAAERPEMSVVDLKNAAFKDFKFSPEQWQKTVTTRLGIENAEMDSFKNNIKKKLQGKNLTQLGSLYNSDADFDDKTDLAIVPGKGGAVTLNFIDKATKTITGSQTFKNESLATEYLNKQATEPETIGSWMMGLREKEAGIAAKEASTAKDRSIAGAYGQTKGGLKQKVADFKEVYGRDPSDEEKGVLAGLVNKPREFTAADVNARAKLMIDGGMTDPDDPAKPLSPQKAIQIANAELSGTPYVSAVDKLISDMAAARQTQAAAPKQTGIKQATPAGQQLLDLYNATTPPPPTPRSVPTTQQERLRAMTIPVRTGLQ